MPVIEFFDGFTRVDFGKRLIVADPDDPRKAQCVAAVMAVAFLNPIEGDLENDIGFHNAEAAVILDGVLLEKLGHILDLAIRQAGVGLADIQQSPVVVDCERVIGEHISAPAVPKFHGSDNYVEGCARLLPFQPTHAPLAGQVQRTRILQHQPFVTAEGCLLKEGLQFGACFKKQKRRNTERGRPFDVFDNRLSFQERLVHQIAAIQRQDVENHQRNGNLPDQRRRRLLPAQAFLKQRKRQNLIVFKSHDLAVDDERPYMESRSGFDNLRELVRYVIQGPRIQSCAAVAQVELTSDAVVFVFHIERAVECGEDLVFRIGWSCEHEFHRPEKPKSNFVELASFGEYGGLANVAKDHVGTPHYIDRAIKGARDGFLDRVLFETDAEVARDDFDDVFHFDGSKGAEKIKHRGHFVGSAGEFDEVGKFGLDNRRTETLTRRPIN